MMDVHIMRWIVDPIERGTMPAVVREAARRWGGQPSVDSLAYVRSSANHIFRFLQDGQPRFLRLAHHTARQRPAIEAELAFIQHVAGVGLTVALPLPSLSGALIEEVSGEGGRYFAVVFVGLRGGQPEVEELDEAGYQTWGRALAMVHRASQSFSPHPARPRWRDEIRAALHTLPPEETAVARVLAAGVAWLETLPSEGGDYGLIHGDFELDNLVWDGERVGVFDFDEAAYAWYAADLAIALQDVWMEAGAERERRLSWFTRGYATIRPLPAGWRDALPRLLTLLSAVKVARVLRAYGALATTPDEHDPAWLAMMRARHHQWLAMRRAALSWL